MEANVALEMALSGVLMRARAVERALHEPATSWSLLIAGCSLPATPQVRPDRVVWTGQHIELGILSGPVILCADGEPVLTGDEAQGVEPGDQVVFYVGVGAPALT